MPSKGILALGFLSRLCYDGGVTDSAWCVDLGLVPYETAWSLQQRLVEARRHDRIPDVLLLCEHPHVLTIGRRPESRSHILSNRFPVVEVERGGDVTYHGPGQLVGYPILKLAPHEQDPHWLLRQLEHALCNVCTHWGIRAQSKPKHTGVWTQNQTRKIASLGIALRHGVSFHGFALNVTTDLRCFHDIHPCGLAASVMTSMEQECKEQQHPVPLSMDEVKRMVTVQLGNQLTRNWIPTPLATIHQEVGQTTASPL